MAAEYCRSEIWDCRGVRRRYGAGSRVEIAEGFLTALRQANTTPVRNDNGNNRECRGPVAPGDDNEKQMQIACVPHRHAPRRVLRKHRCHSERSEESLICFSFLRVGHRLAFCAFFAQDVFRLHPRRKIGRSLHRNHEPSSPPRVRSQAKENARVHSEVRRNKVGLVRTARRTHDRHRSRERNQILAAF
jgi:hypothetical protein